MAKKTPPVGQGRISMSLGSGDPRLHRNANAVLRSQNNLDRTLRMDSNGRMGVQGARRVDDIPADATMEDVILKLNEILRSQRDSGQMEGGR